MPEFQLQEHKLVGRLFKYNGLNACRERGGKYKVEDQGFVFFPSLGNFFQKSVESSITFTGLIIV